MLSHHSDKCNKLVALHSSNVVILTMMLLFVIVIVYYGFWVGPFLVIGLHAAVIVQRWGGRISRVIPKFT